MVHRTGEGLTPKRYDRSYFERWYRGGRSGTRTELRRRVGAVLSLAELLLGRQVRSVLDVGCGEARWFPVLRELRPSCAYDGVDPSEYAVARYGARRNVVSGSIHELHGAEIGERYDVVVCADVLHYVRDRELRRGVRQMAERCRGVAYLEVFTAEDEFDGDRREWHARPARWYRRVFRSAGLIPCGMHCYAAPPVHGRLAALEHLT